MTITLDLPEAAAQRLQEEAKRAGLSVSDYVMQVVAQSLAPQDEWVRTLNSGHVNAGVSLSDEQTRREIIYDN